MISSSCVLDWSGARQTDASMLRMSADGVRRRFQLNLPCLRGVGRHRNTRLGFCFALMEEE